MQPKHETESHTNNLLSSSFLPSIFHGLIVIKEFCSKFQKIQKIVKTKIFEQRIHARTSYDKDVRNFKLSTTGPMKLSYLWIWDRICED